MPKKIKRAKVEGAWMRLSEFLEKQPERLADIPWTPFVDAPNVKVGDWVHRYDRQQLVDADLVRPLKRVLANSRYVVSVTTEPSPWGDLDHLDIKRIDRAALHDWRDLQRIKNEICGPEREAIELYPRESRLVDTANSYHLYVLPEGQMIPVGWLNRLVVEGEDKDIPGQPRQRPWPQDESRPKDLLTVQDVEKIIDAELKEKKA